CWRPSCRPVNGIRAKSRSSTPPQITPEPRPQPEEVTAMRNLALVDGEHYPPVTRWGLEVARERGYDVVAAVLVGGIEKLGAGETPDLGVPVRTTGADRAPAIPAAIDDLRPDVVLDLSAEPILGYRERMAVAAVVLAR